MNTESAILKAEDIADPYSLPLKDINPSRGELFLHGKQWDYFKRLREEAPVHLCESGPDAPFWSITKFNDIIAVDTNHQVFSSSPDVILGEGSKTMDVTNFIATDPPIHGKLRKPVQPAVAPSQLSYLETKIRQTAADILDALPIGREFNWVERVSIELTTSMLATLFGVPQEDRHKLVFWSDTATTSPATGGEEIDVEKRDAILMECYEYFMGHWMVKAEQPPSFDFVSLYAHHPNTQNMAEDPFMLMGNMLLLIIGGNDTTRNSISGGALALNEFPGEYEKIKANHHLIPNMVSEMIRYQSPVIHMRRTVLQDIDFKGKPMKKGDKVVMWYMSGNRDEDVIDNADQFIIDRTRARHHLAFGYGIHRCMGNRMAEMQIRILWEEILKRFEHVEVTGKVERVQSNFIHGIADLPVTLHNKR